MKASAKYTGKLLAAVTLAAGLTFLSGCGRKGPLEPHPADTSEARGQRSAINTSDPLASGGRAPRRTLSSPVTPSREPFILDPLL
ncbi:MAG: hypothetical protein FJX29_00865 [Alphaproteobacteria bacterium]|nr:hypothetical protein [Alphaproteobacteria bacterium]